MTDINTRLARHPELQKRVEGLLDIVESSSEELARADDAERYITEQIRQLGHDALTDWAEQRVAQQATRGDGTETWRRAGKKTLLVQ